MNLRRSLVPGVIVLALSAALALSMDAAPRSFSIGIGGKSTAGFTIDDTIEKVDGSTSKVSGTIVLDAENLAASTVEMSVDLASLDTGNGMRDDDMRDTLATSKFPAATFRSAVVNAPASIVPGQAIDIRVGGDFTLHGVTHRISTPVHLTFTGDKLLRATSKFTIRMTDYDITVPDKLIVSVANEVVVRFDVIASAKSPASCLRRAATMPPMLGRVAVLSLSFLLVSRIFAQCGGAIGYSGEFRASYLDLAVDGNELWTATGYGIQVFDRSTDPPTLVASISVPGTTRVVRIGNGLVYAASGTRIYAIRKSNRTLTIAGSVDTTATVNDLLVTPLDLYAATSAGLLQYDLLNPAGPVKTPASLPTSSASVTSLALSESTLYAADGDSTVEVFSITVPSFPEHTGTVGSLAHSIAVKTATGRLYVSDGFTTDAFVVSGSNFVRATNASFGTLTMATFINDAIVAAAGNDRRFHVIDWTTPAAPVELFASDVVPTGGTINRPAAIAIAGARLYVAGGDAGLQTFDTSGFTAPYPVRSYGGAPTVSSAWVDGKLYASRADGGIEEFIRSSAGNLTAARQWDSRVHTLYEGGNGFLLSSTGSLLTFWTLNSTTPMLVSSATLPTTIVGAALFGNQALIVLADHSLGSADLTQNPAKLTLFGTIIGGPPPLQADAIAHSGNSVVLSRVLDDGTTDLAYFTSPSLSNPVTVNVPGASVTGVTLSGTMAAVFTFNGISLVDFAAKTTTIVPQSNSSLARQLVLSGSRLFETTDSQLIVWDTTSKRAIRTMSLPNDPDSLSIDTVAGMASSTGVMTAAFDSTTQLPTLVGLQNPNTYYKKVVAAGDHIYLFDGRSVDIFSTTVGLAPHFIASVRQQGLVDFAVSQTRLYTLSSAGGIGAYSRDGVSLGQTTLNEGSNVQPLAIAAAGNAAWIAIARGCLSGSCEKKTVVYDGASLIRTTSLDGAVVALTTSGSRTWALFDLPSELRLYDTADADHPALITSTVTPGSKTPASLAVANNSVYVLGEKLYIYPITDFTQHSEALSAYQPDPAGAFSYVDQRIRVDASCVLITGRSFSPQLYQNGTWSNPQLLNVPAPVRSVGQTTGIFDLLTDDSLEIFTSEPGAVAPRKRASR